MDLGQTVRDALKRWTFSLAPDAEARFHSLTTASNEYGVDPFGLDVNFALSAVAPFVWMYKHYFRVSVLGIENVPEGRVLLISNHSGQLPFDGAMIGIAMMVEAAPPRIIRAMVDHWVPSLPFVSTFMARCGQVVGTPENCRRLLAADESILVFPEGMKGILKPYRQRYQLEAFGQGFMRLALATDTPIVPIAVVGAEEQAPAIADIKSLGKLLNLPTIPITPTLLPIPLPVKYHIAFGEPMRFTGRTDDDEDELDRKVRQVRSTVQTMLQQGVAERKHVFW